VLPLGVPSPPEPLGDSLLGAGAGAGAESSLASLSRGVLLRSLADSEEREACSSCRPLEVEADLRAPSPELAEEWSA
jgi:hypothetical protein